MATVITEHYIMLIYANIINIKIKILKEIFLSEPKAMNSYLATHTRAANSFDVAL